jgi:hypothetical protein
MSEHDWLEPLDCRIEQVRQETAAIKKETARLQAWKDYCEASLGLSNQEDVGEREAAALAALDRLYTENADGMKRLANS